MYKDVLNIMCCPVCKTGFQLKASEVEGEEVVEGILTCVEGHRYAIHRGVVDFCSKEQTIGNQWSESYKETDYETLDREIESAKSDADKQRQQSVLDGFVSELEGMGKGFVVDIASGRGMLLTTLAQVIKDSVHIIATDLSFEVLMYDRLKVKKINPNLCVTYLACDATALPLKPEAADAVVSFFGIANMLGIVEKGIKEASRILKPEGKLLNSFLLIKENSNGYVALSRLCAENQMTGAEKAYLEAEIETLHSRFFSEASCQVVCEAIKEAEHNPLDLLPYPGEWFAEVIFNCKK